MKTYQEPTLNTVRALVELYKQNKSLTVAELNEQVQEKFTPGHLLALARRGFVEVTRVQGATEEVNSYKINSIGLEFLEDKYLDQIEDANYMKKVFGTDTPRIYWHSVDNQFESLFLFKI